MDQHLTKTNSPWVKWSLTIIRIFIGWHFLYEGIVKLANPDWSSAGYLLNARWILGDMFRAMAGSEALVNVFDFLNIWGLILIGLGLMLGLLVRAASVSGIFLLLVYYLASPPFIGQDFGVAAEGSYLVINKNLIEMAMLVFLTVAPKHLSYSLDQLIKLFRIKRKKEKSSAEASPVELDRLAASDEGLSRRAILKNLIGIPFLGALTVEVIKKAGYESYEEANIRNKVDGITGSTIRTFDFSSLKDLNGPVPKASIKGVEFSRIILGGNLIGGWAHARDLIYASKLVKAYHTKSKVYETFMLAEQCGVNAFLTNPVLCGVIAEYWKRDLGKIKFISDCGGGDVLEMIQKSIDAGASACYIQGAVADKLVRDEKFNLMQEALELIWKNGLPAGIGGHPLITIQRSVEMGLKPDFWMKTLHHHNYWSAENPSLHDNMWCYDPEETISYMESLDQPWIAFKTMAAGAIKPEDAFRYAFENGADFVCAGMYDFQMVEDINIANKILESDLSRKRDWRA